jgi:hypothetical protein
MPQAWEDESQNRVKNVVRGTAAQAATAARRRGNHLFWKGARQQARVPAGTAAALIKGVGLKNLPSMPRENHRKGAGKRGVCWVCRCGTVQQGSGDE